MYKKKICCHTIEVRVEEEIKGLCERLQWIDLEEEVITIQPSLVEEVRTRERNCLLVKLLSLKYFNKEAFKVTMKKV